MSEKFICEEPGCEEDAIICSLNDDEDTEEHFCPDHCYKHGYCFGCGNFFSGCEDFDFNNPSHLCSNCRTDAQNDDDGDWSGSYYEPPFSEEDL
jgi:hypothetical protein